jgi:ribose/xylose/arabinose/galactoside ABC-type transport system permease subunit
MARLATPSPPVGGKGTEKDPAASARPRPHRNWAALAQRFGATAALVALFAFNAIDDPELFLTSQNLLYTVLRQAAPIAIVALGMALVISTGGVDLSIGSVAAIAGQVGALALLSGNSAIVALLLALAAATVCGLFNGALVAFGGVQPIIATLILFIAGRGIAQLISNGQLQSFGNDPGVDATLFEVLGRGKIAALPSQVFLLVLIAGAMILLARATSTGRYLVSVGGNQEASRLAGVPARRVKLTAYVLSSILAGLVGLMAIGRGLSSDGSNLGLGLELDAIAAVAIAGTPLTGGKLSPAQTVIGAVMLTLLQNTLISNGVPKEVAQIIQGVIIVMALLVQRRSGEVKA